MAGKAKNWGKKFIYPYPHEEKEHSCGKIHYCKEKFKYFGESKGCETDCKLEYNHERIHQCGGKHYCIKDCYLKEKSRNFDEKCILELPHEGKEHSCGKSIFAKKNVNILKNQKDVKKYVI